MSVKIVFEVDGQQHEIELPDAVARDLADIASRNGLSLVAALQQALSNEKYLEELLASGAKLLFEKDDKLRYLERESAVLA